MFGTKLRSWMEAHIVRSRKKQRSKDLTSGKQSAKGSAPDSANNGEKGDACEGGKGIRDVGPVDRVECKLGKGPMNLGGEGGKTLNCTVQNLSSPESAYSTGYSTDGTSPGASIPPEYYINLRTGKHYVHATTGNTTLAPGDGSRPALPVHPLPAHSSPALTPRSARRRREEALKRKPKIVEGLPESSTEEDIADRPSKPYKASTPKNQRKLAPPVPGVNLHRRTESCDESQRLFPFGSERDSEGSSSTQTGSSMKCLSPYLSTASPRQRNRIRTNPWLGANANSLSPCLQEKNKHYTSQGETSSTVGSSSTLSSSGCKEKMCRDESRMSFSPKPQNKQLEDLRNLNIFRSPSHTASPLVNGRKHLATVTTCSPLPNRPCKHFRPCTSSSSSSAPSSGSDDNHHGNTSDFSDDDVTLNEMLGKYDESYVYEKETDILSDSDPTDCEEQNDYNGRGFARGRCSYYNVPGHTPDLCRRQCSRNRRGDASGASSRGSSVCNRRFRRSNSRQSDEIASSVDGLPKRVSRKKPQKPKKSPEDGPEYATVAPKNTAEPGRHMNLNRVLMERLINNQRSGTRSADGTPVSLRKSDYNGKYLRNPNVSKLINSTNLDKRSGTDEDRKGTYVVKKRSNSLTNQPPALPPRNPKNEADKDGDIKYRQLIKEAENIMEDFKVKRHEYLSPTLSTRSAIYPNPNPNRNPAPCNIYENDVDMHSQLSLLEEKINNNPLPKPENEESIFKAISKTLEKIIIRSDSRKTDKSDSFKGKKKAALNGNTPDTNEAYYAHPVNSNLRNSTEVLTTTDTNENIFTKIAPLSLMPASKGIDIVRGSDGLTPVTLSPRAKNYKRPPRSFNDNFQPSYMNQFQNDPSSPQSPLIPFQSFDLGNQIAVSSRYCPQSEPVKRKVYVGSSSFGRLQKSLMRKSPSNNTGDITTEELRDKNESLKDKVAALRRERLQVEARVRETQEQIDRLKLTDAITHC